MARFKRGAAPKLNLHLIQSVADSIRSGSSIESSAATSGISKDTFYRWLHSKEGRYTSPLILAFKEKVGSAIEYSRLKNLGLLGPIDHKI